MTKRLNPSLDELSPLAIFLPEPDLLAEIIFPLLATFQSLKSVFAFIACCKSFSQKWSTSQAQRLEIFRNIITYSSELAKIQFDGVHFLRVMQSSLAIMVDYTLSEIITVLLDGPFRCGPDTIADMKKYCGQTKTYGEVWLSVDEMLRTKEDIGHELVDDDGLATSIVENIMLLVCLKIRLHYDVNLCYYKIDDDHVALYWDQGVDPDDCIGFVPIGMRINSNSDGFTLNIGKRKNRVKSLITYK